MYQSNSVENIGCRTNMVFQKKIVIHAMLGITIKISRNESEWQFCSYFEEAAVHAWDLEYFLQLWMSSFKKTLMALFLTWLFAHSIAAYQWDTKVQWLRVQTSSLTSWSMVVSPCQLASCSGSHATWVNDWEVSTGGCWGASSPRSKRSKFTVLEGMANKLGVEQCNP